MKKCTKFFFFDFFSTYISGLLYTWACFLSFFSWNFFLNFCHPFPFPTKNKFFRQITVVILFTKVVHNLKSSTATRLKWNEVVGTMLYLKCAILLPYLLMTMTRHNTEIIKHYPRNLFLGYFFILLFLFIF